MPPIPLDFLSSALTTLFVVIDPLGLAPIFLGVTMGMDPSQRRRVAFRAISIAAVVLVASAFGGRPLLEALGITVPAFRIAGGLMLFAIAFEMVFERRQKRKSRSAQAAITQDDISNVAAFPMAVPLMAGPGAITAVILLSGTAAGDPIKLAVLMGSIAAILMLTLIALLLATRIERLLGITGRIVITRLLGVLLAALSVQFVADGVRELVLSAT